MKPLLRPAPVSRGMPRDRNQDTRARGASCARHPWFLALGSCLFAGVAVAHAQDLLAPPTTEELLPPALQQARAAALQAPPMQVAPTTLPDTTLFDWGPATLRSHLTYRYLYGDGIPSTPGQNYTTSINSISPDFLLDVGTHWMMDYTPTWRFYSNRAFKDTVDESARLAGATSYEDWNFSLTQNYALTSDPQVETGRQTKQETAATNLGATWQLNSELTLELTGTQLLQYLWAAPDSFQWSTLDWLHYQAAPGVDTAIGLGYGYVDMTEGPDMTYEQYLGRIGWQVNNKVSLSLQGGGETRKFEAAGKGDMNNVIYDASVQYRLMEQTVLSLSGNRAVTPSFFADQVTRNSSVGASLQQRFLGRFFLNVGFQHGTSNYLSSAPGVVAGRDDTFNSINLRLSTALLGRGTVAVTYQHSQNSSNTEGYRLTSSQYGVELAWRF